MELNSVLSARLEARDWPKELKRDLVEQFELLLLCTIRKRILYLIPSF